ncbi:hypothetical protein TRFO_35832 [Tritrichomonas foetus]|uniref:Uncharacterized protein n=1 Tax=Tritrichomonas foetus TaxID=1144522 RepID=A0A1J4JHZ1_9EUKA|nr:hypothetical protein TRFO_35832 [Tritrichomonas foetus]|eukprot:OHS97871.1 hypothetical protein TRFO_35832 [Tritrichomonas foetus]
MQQREENLAEEKRKLELAKLKLHADFEELERERKALEEEENEINGFNGQMMKDQTELGRQSLYLQKMAADLKKQVEQAQMELEGLQKNEKKDDQKCQKMIASQQIRVDKLCELMNLMNNEILSTENDVIQMELAALDHKKLVEEAENFKQQIDLRRMKAINKKNQLLELSSQRNAKMSKMEASFDSVKKRLIDAQTERDRLNKIMAQCEARENELNERKDDLNQRQKNLEQKQKDRIQLQQNIRDELEQRQRDLAEHPIDPNFDLHTLEEEVIKEETELSEKVAQFEAKNNQTLSALNEKKEKLTQDIENIKGHINGGKSLEDLMKELKEAQAECSNSKKIMETRQREIEELREKVLSEADISNKNKEIQLESRRIITLEREVNNLQSKVQVDEEAIENDEEAFNETRNEIESETKMIALKEEASNKMLFLYKGQLEQATERYKNLVQQIEKYNANF